MVILKSFFKNEQIYDEVVGEQLVEAQLERAKH